MKKTVLILLILVLCLTSLFALTACNRDGDLQFGIKYSYYRLEDTEHIDYYIFNKNLTGEYHRKSSISDYIIYFKYSFLDDDKSTVACYYDSHENMGSPSYAPSNGWTSVLIVSKTAVIENGKTCYTSEKYLDEIPNYRKPS